MTLFEVEYLVYSSPTTVHVVAPTITAALDKAKAIVEKKFADRVSAIKEIFTDVVVA